MEPDQLRNRPQNRAQAYVVVSGLVTTLAVNMLANILPLNGRTTGQVAQGFHELFRPAAYVFGVWGLIYAGLVLFAVFQLLPSQRGNSRLDTVRVPFLWSCVANVAWLFLWHYELFSATLGAMALLLGSLIVINQRLHWGEGTQSTGELLCVEAPFRVYLAWISVASLANLSIWVEAQRLMPTGLSPEVFAMALILIASLVSTLVALFKHDALYLAVVVWALIGIAVRNGPSSSVGGVAMAGVLALGALIVHALLWNRSHGAVPPFHRAGTAT